jgi:hypothetical protein
LSLTEEQKKAKESVILPYVHQGQPFSSSLSLGTPAKNPISNEEKSGIIYIDADDDAFQASDPDEDLDI